MDHKNGNKKWYTKIICTKIIPIVLISAGILLVSVPIVSRIYAKYEQEKMILYVKKQIEENKKIKPDLEQLQFEEIDINEDQETNGRSNQDVEKSKLRDELIKKQIVLGMIEIKSIDVLYPIVEGTHIINMRTGIGHMIGTPIMGEIGNCVLAGHRGSKYGDFLININKVQIGDDVKVTNLEGEEIIYKVYEQFIVEPTDMYVTDNVVDDKILTIISCEDNATKRIITKCKVEY